MNIKYQNRSEVFNLIIMTVISLSTVNSRCDELSWTDPREMYGRQINRENQKLIRTHL